MSAIRSRLRRRATADPIDPRSREAAGAHTLAQASATGSPRARQWARIMAWSLIVAIIVVPTLFAVGSLLFSW